MSTTSDSGQTYAAAGVDIDAGSRLAARIKEIVRSAGRPEVLAGVGPFAALFRLGDYRDPVLVASADGVGTKLKLAAAMRRFDTVGVDIVNHCVNDILTSGAEPLFFLDYIASARAGAERTRWPIVQGMADGLPRGRLRPHRRRDGRHARRLPGRRLRPRRLHRRRRRARRASSTARTIQAGDVLLGLPSNGLHTNGYSLARRVFSVGLGGDPEAEKAALHRTYPELGVTLGEALLAPHRCYYREVKPAARLSEGHRPHHRRRPHRQRAAHPAGGPRRPLRQGHVEGAAHLYPHPARG